MRTLRLGYLTTDLKNKLPFACRDVDKANGIDLLRNDTQIGICADSPCRPSGGCVHIVLKKRLKEISHAAGCARIADGTELALEFDLLDISRVSGPLMIIGVRGQIAERTGQLTFNTKFVVVLPPMLALALAFLRHCVCPDVARAREMPTIPDC